MGRKRSTGIHLRFIFPVQHHRRNAASTAESPSLDVRRTVEPNVSGGQTPLWLRRTLLAGLLGGLLLLGFIVLRPFLVAIAWTAFLQSGQPLPEPILRIPWVGPWLQEQLVQIGSDSAAWGRQLSELTAQWGGHAMRIAGGIGLNALSFGAALLTAFFLFRDGDHLLEQLRSILRGLLGDRVQAYFTAVGATTRAVVYGLLLAAFAQGLTAGLG